MNLSFEMSQTREYRSLSQKARVMTECWISKNMFCPLCGNLHLEQFENNRPVADFYCNSCKNQYELKSKSGKFGHSVADGSYDTMIGRIKSNDNPHFLFLNYSMELFSVTDLCFVPNYFFTPTVIEKRPPLSSGARRFGWVGCKISLSKIPRQGIIPIVVDGVATDIKTIRQRVQRAIALRTDRIETRGWIFDVLNCVNSLPNDEFSLADIYKFEGHLQLLHPDNHNIKDKIRQQLQYLRDAGLILFLDRGHYRRIQ